MPVVGFIHPITRKNVKGDYFKTDDSRAGRVGGVKVGTCAVPPWIPPMVEKGAAEDVRHGEFQLTTTRTFGCPRATYIQSRIPYFLDLNKVYARERGTACHIIAAQNLPADTWYSEATDPLKMDAHGRLWKGVFEEVGDLVTSEGVTLSGLMDGVKRDMSEIIDWKFPKDWSVRFRSKTGEAKEMHTIQMNINRLLLGQQEWAIREGFDANAVKLIVWDHGLGNNEGPCPLFAEHVTEEGLLQMSAGPDSPYVVGDVVAQHIATYKMHLEADGDPIKEREVAKATPCMGAEKFRGNGCLMYCDVSHVSAQLSRETAMGGK